MEAPPPLPVSSARRRRPPVLVAGLVAATVVLAVLASLVWNEVRREDSPESYARLCELLLKPLPLATGAAEIQATEAESTVRHQQMREELIGLSQRSRRLAPVAEDMARELAALEQLSKDQPSLSSLILSGAEAAVGLRLGNDEMAVSGSKGALQELKGYGQVLETILGAKRRIEIARVQLAGLAPEFSGPAATNSLVQCEFTETAPSLLDRVLGDKRASDSVQTLRLRNRSGRRLSQCVVSVRLVRPSGESFLHLYRVVDWKDGQWRGVGYVPTGLFAETDEDVDRVQVTLAAREATSPVETLSRKGEHWPFAK